MPITNRLDGVRRGLTSSRIKAGLGIILAVAVVLFAGCNGDEVDPTATTAATNSSNPCSCHHTYACYCVYADRTHLLAVGCHRSPLPRSDPNRNPDITANSADVNANRDPNPDTGTLHRSWCTSARKRATICWSARFGRSCNHLAERCTFLELRPSLVKVQSFHPPSDIAKLAASQPQARWIVRSFLEFGGRAISPDEFVNSLSDTQRSLDVLRGRDVVVELHNEPNLYAEGWDQPGRMAPVSRHGISMSWQIPCCIARHALSISGRVAGRNR